VILKPNPRVMIHAQPCKLGSLRLYSQQLQKDGHQEPSIHRLHLLPPMFYRALVTLLTLASFAFAIPTLYLVGDSTMADRRRTDVQGYVVPMCHCGNHKSFPCRWGKFIPNYLDGLNIVNKAIAGRSARSYTREGRWSEVQGLLNAGDYVIIEFGLCHRLRGRVERLTVLFRAQ